MTNNSKTVKKSCLNCGASFGCDRSLTYSCGPESKHWLPKSVVEKMKNAEDCVGCPICGEKPLVSTIGASIDIECCVGMSRQKSDYLTLDERDAWDNREYRYSPEAEAKVLDLVVTEWNTRA